MSVAVAVGHEFQAVILRHGQHHVAALLRRGQVVGEDDPVFGGGVVTAGQTDGFDLDLTGFGGDSGEADDALLVGAAGQVPATRPDDQLGAVLAVSDVLGGGVRRVRVPYAVGLVGDGERLGGAGAVGTVPVHVEDRVRGE